MGVSIQVYVDLSFKGRLLRGDELHHAELQHFVLQIEEYGVAVFFVPGYCLLEEVEQDAQGAPSWLHVLLKESGIWTRYFLQVRAPDVWVLFDRRP